MKQVEHIRSELGRILEREAQIDPQSIDENSTLGQMDVASVDMVMVVYAIEEELGVEILQEDLSRGTTLGDLVELVRARSATLG